MRLVLRKYYLLLVCTISLFTANNSLQAQNVLDQAGLTSATPAAAAYATRKLSSSYTGAAVRIRRQSDNAVADLAFDVNGNISANSQATFVSGGTGSVSVGSFAAATNAFVSIWYDQSGNGRNATQTTAANQPLLVSNGVVVTSSVLNSKATLSFNGSSQFMDLPMSSSIINAAGTIAAVQVQPVLQSGFNAVVAWSLSGGTQGPGFGPLNSPGAFGLYTTWGPNNITLGPVAINQAYVLNATWSGNGSAVVQSRNGTIVNGSLGASFNYTGNAWIGRDVGAFYNGNLAELIVSNTTITAGNRTALETNQNNAYTNAGALNFDGSNDYVNLGNILGASYTKEAWVNISNAAAVNNFISGGAASQHAFWAPNAYGNRLSAGHNEIWNQVQDPTALVAGQWYHVAVTYDAPTTTMKLYKNGVLVSSNNAVPAYGGGGNVVLLGAYDLSTNLLAGSLDETRIWSRVLCQTEIQNNMNAMLGGTQTGLTAYYKFNQGITGANNSAITTVTDASGNNRTGTMVGFNNTGATSNWVAGFLSPTAVSPVYNTPVNLISGLSIVCVNGTTTLTNSSTGTWSSSNTAVATISASGVVTGVSAGTTTITFTGICSGISNLNFTVNALPVVTAGSNSPVLVNGTINLTATGADTYSWTGPNSFNSTQQNPTISNATNLSSGKYTVTATTTATGCAAIASTNVAVNKPFTAVVAFDPRKATIFAGSGISGATDGTGTAAQFNNPSGIAIDASGNLYVSETSGHRIRKITAAGVVTTVAGAGVAGNVNATGTAAKFNSPRAVALDPTGTILYVADNQNYSIRKIVLATGAVTTYAGTGTQGNVDGPSATAKFVTPTGVTVDPSGNVYVADLQLGNRIRKISTTGIVSTVYNGLTYCSDIIQDINGNLITTAMIGYVVEKVSPDSIKTRVAGSGLRGSIDGPAATATFNFPMGLTMDAAGNIFLTENDGNRIRKISAGGNVTTVAGSGAYSSIDGIGTGASIYSPNGVVMDAAGNLFVTEYGGHKIRKLSAPTFSAFTSVSGTASAVQQINISGASLSGNITVTAPTGFEVSLSSNASFTSSITVNATANEVASTIIYVRLAAAAPVGVYNANLSLSATGATTQTMPLNGTVTCPVTTASITNATPGINLGNTATLVANSGGGNAIKFNGTNTYLDLGTGPVLPNTFTQEAWIYSGSGNDGLFHGFLGYQVGGNSATRPPSMYIYNGTAIHGGFGDGTGFYYYITQPGQILQNTWNHIAQTFDGTTLRCYVNGVLASNATYISPAGKTPLATGVKNIGRVDNYFNGDIDEVRMWNITRTQAQIQADMNKGIPTNTTGLVSYFKMEEGSGLTTVDTKSGTTASLVNAPVWTVSSAPIGGTVVWSPSTGLNTTVGPIALASPATTTTYTATVTDGTSGCAVTGTTTVTVFNQPATALALDGANDYVKVADNASLDFGANDFTVETWTLKQANSVSYSNSGLVGKWNTGSFPGTNEWILNNTSNGTDNLPAFLIENGTSFYRVAGTSPMILNQWYHLAAVKKGALLSLYVNGVLAATTTIPANTVLNNVGRDLLIGGYIVNGSGIPTLFSSAKLDELRIWNRALCLSEINNNRNGELTGTQNGLVAYYKFNQGFIGGNNVGITTLADASGNNNNGTLFNFASTATGNWVAGTVIGNSPTFVPATAPNTGTASACIGATRNLANTNQGVWSSSNTSVAIVNAAGLVTAIAAGNTTITFTNTCGGVSTTTFTVNPKPTASISTASPLTVCLGGAVLLDASTNASQQLTNGLKMA
jgi:sugar lactone lactonase YvrE